MKLNVSNQFNFQSIIRDKEFMACNNDAIECQTYSSSNISIEESVDIKLSKIKQRLYDIKRDPYIEILNFETIIENRPTEIDETSSRVLKYKSPSFM